MPRFMEYSEPKYRLLSAAVFFIGALALSGLLYGFITLMIDLSPRTDGMTITGKVLQVTTTLTLVALYFFFLYWQMKLRAVRASIKGLHAACEGTLDEDGMGTLLQRSIIGELGLRYEVVHHTGHADDVFGINRYLDNKLDYSWTVFPNKITDQSRDLLPISLMPGFNNLAMALRGWVVLNKSRHFGFSSEHVKEPIAATEDGLASLGLNA